MTDTLETVDYKSQRFIIEMKLWRGSAYNRVAIRGLTGREWQPCYNILDDL